MCAKHRNCAQSTSSSPRTWPCWRASQSLPPESLHRPERRWDNWLVSAAAWNEGWQSSPGGFQTWPGQPQSHTPCTESRGMQVSRGFSHRIRSGAHSRAAQLQWGTSCCSWSVLYTQRILSLIFIMNIGFWFSIHLEEKHTSTRISEEIIRYYYNFFFIFWFYKSQLCLITKHKNYTEQ